MLAGALRLYGRHFGEASVPRLLVIGVTPEPSGRIK